jgi:hypothetical protein
MKRFFILMMLCASTLSIFAETAYEKKVAEICTKYYCYGTYGYNRGLDTGDLFAIAMLGAEGAATIALMDYGTKYNLQQAEEWYECMRQELEAAKSLMTDEDRFEEWKKSEYGKMAIWIQNQYSSKFTKDEFETSKQFYTRIEPEAKSLFNELCVSLYEQITQSLKIKISPAGYDAETQTSTVKICETFKYNDNELKKEFSIKLQIPSHQARNFKEYEVSSSQIKNIKFGIIDDKEVYVISAQVPFLLGTSKDSDQVINIKYPDSRKATSFGFNSKQIDKNAPWEIFWNAERIEESKNLINNYNKVLSDSVGAYKRKLGEHPYFHTDLGVKINTDDFLLPTTMIGASTQDIKTAYNKKIAQLSKEYHKLNNSLEDLCKTNYPKHHADVYCKLHPEFATKVDSIHHNYRCEYSANEIAIKLLAGQTISGQTCQESQYTNYKHLFKSQEEFLMWYNKTREEFDQEVERRNSKYKRFEIYLNSEVYGKLNFLNAKIAEDARLSGIIAQHNELKEMCNMSANVLISKNQKMLSEYQKTSMYWANADEFFEAYISGTYKQILKDKKKQNK